MSDTAIKSLLLLLPLLPVVGAVVASLTPRSRQRSIMAAGWVSSIATLVVWVVLRIYLVGTGEILVEIHTSWIPSMGISFHLGLDSTGVMMSGLVTFVGVAGSVGTFSRDKNWNRAHVVSMLLAEAGMLGVVVSLDLILFMACWELILVAFFLLLGRDTGGAGVASATHFVVISVASSVLMWVGVLWLVQLNGLPASFDLVELSNKLHAMDRVPNELVWLMDGAFLVRMAVFPLHTWLPASAAEVPTAAGVLLVGGVLPLGGFGLDHVLLRLFGPGLGGMAQWFVWLGLFTALAGGLGSLVQRDLKRLFAYVCISQMGLVLAALCSNDVLGHQGGLMLVVASGLGGSSLFIFAGVVCHARGSQRVSDISGLWRSHPLFAGLAFAGVACAAAVPATAGFVGIFRFISHSMDDRMLVLLAASAILITGSSVVWAYRRVLGGGFHNEVWTRERWPRKRQVAILFLLAVAIILAGLFPKLVTPAENVQTDCSSGDYATGIDGART